jgi:hypothetical protein
MVGKLFFVQLVTIFLLINTISASEVKEDKAEVTPEVKDEPAVTEEAKVTPEVKMNQL